MNAAVQFIGAKLTYTLFFALTVVSAALLLFFAFREWLRVFARRKRREEIVKRWQRMRKARRKRIIKKMRQRKKAPLLFKIKNIRKIVRK